METTERIVEAYVRYIKGCATLPNIRCPGQFEIDLLAIHPLNLQRYHIESGVSISGPYSKLTDKPFREEDLRTRVRAAGQRRTLGYFMERKFGAKEVIQTLEKYGFKHGNYEKVIVSWGWTSGAAAQAQEANITLWDFRDILQALSGKFKDKRQYFTDDTLRTLHLLSHALTKPGRV
jgi:hypothetical protein